MSQEVTATENPYAGLSREALLPFLEACRGDRSVMAHADLFEAAWAAAPIITEEVEPEEEVEEFILDYTHPKFNRTKIDQVLLKHKISPAGKHDKEAIEICQNIFDVEEKKAAELIRKHEIRMQGLKIYRDGKFIQYCKENFQKIWYGDLHILQAVLYVGASFYIDNANEPVHLHVAGTTQSGKSDSVKTALKFIHANNKLTSTFSPRWIYYATDTVHENMMLFSDDTVLDNEVAAIYRNILTSWHDGVVRGTVTPQGTARTLTIPPHISLILTSIESVVEESAEGQDESRFMTMEIRRSVDDERRIREFIQQEKPDITPILEIIQEIWGSIPIKKIELHKQFEMDIPNRDFKRFLTLVKCHALLCNREETTDEDVDAVEKFLTYSKPMIDAVTDAYTKNENSVLNILKEGRIRSVNQLADDTKLSYLQVARALHGRQGTFSNPVGGLLGKSKVVRIKYDLDLHENQVWILPSR